MRILFNPIIPEKRISFNSAFESPTSCTLEVLQANQLSLVTPKLNNSDSFLTPIATTVDGKQIQPIPDKTWSSIEARIDQVKKMYGLNGNGESGVAIRYSWNGDAQKPQYAIFSEKINGTHEVTYYPPGIKKPVVFTVPMDAKKWGLDFSSSQPYYDAATGTRMYWGKESGSWYSKPGVDFVRTDPKILADPILLQKEIDKAVDSLIIDTGTHKEMIVDYTGNTRKVLIRKDNGQIIYGLQLTGGKKIDTATKIKNALKGNLRFYFNSNNDLPKSKLASNMAINNADILAVLKSVGKIIIMPSDELPGTYTNRIIGNTFWPQMPASSGDSGNPIRINFPSLYTIGSATGNMPFINSDELEKAITLNIASTLLAQSILIVNDPKTVDVTPPECGFSVQDEQFTQILISTNRSWFLSVSSPSMTNIRYDSQQQLEDITMKKYQAATAGCK